MKTFLTTAAIGAAALSMIAIVLAPPALSQQSAAPAGASGRGRGAGGMRGAAQPFDFNDNAGFQSLFDGQTLNGWEGAPGMWDVQDGSIHIDTACEHPTGTTYIYWKGGNVSDFILKYQMKGTINVNGGMQFRSFLTDDPNAEKYPAPPARAGGFPPGGFSGGRGGRGGSGRGGRAGGGGGGGDAARRSPAPPLPRPSPAANLSPNGI